MQEHGDIFPLVYTAFTPRSQNCQRSARAETVQRTLIYIHNHEYLYCLLLLSTG